MARLGMRRVATGLFLWSLGASAAPKKIVEHHSGRVHLPGLGTVPPIALWIGGSLGALLALWAISSLIMWIRRPPCERCGSKNVHYSGAKRIKSTPYRCVNCGYTNAYDQMPGERKPSR